MEQFRDHHYLFPILILDTMLLFKGDIWKSVKHLTINELRIQTYK